MSVATCIDNFLAGGDLHSAIGAGLRDCAADVSNCGHRTWRFNLSHAHLGEGTARCEPHWLVVDVPIHQVSQRAVDPWKVLEFHSAAPAGIKLLAPLELDRPPRLRAELPLDCCDEQQIIRRIGDLCRGIVQAANLFSQAAWGPGEDQPEQAHGREVDPVDLAALCAECGWPCEPRRGGTRFMAKLEVARAPYRAMIEQRADGGIDARVDLSSGVMQTQVTLGSSADLPDAPTTLEEPCRAALAIVLGAVADRVRLVRGAFDKVTTGAASEMSTGLVIRLEAAIPRLAVAADVSHALAALSVACERCGPEAQLLLTDSSIAEVFLARGWSPRLVVTARDESSRLVTG